VRIASLQKFSMIDFPNELSAVIFTQGCNFRCPYCHNPELVDSSKFTEAISEESILKFLDSRVGKLDGVVITGGEPTIHKDLISFISKIKKMGFLVKLDTNGTNPGMIKEIIQHNLIDYIAMDYKAPLGKYSDVVRVHVDLNDILESIELIKKSGLKYEFRTTVVENLLSSFDVKLIQMELGEGKKYCIQNFVASKTLDDKFMTSNPFSEDTMEKLKENEYGVFLEKVIR
jgi:pyruvate formate lyase activating enzyme